MDVALHHGRVEDLDPAVLYAVLRLRVDVFVVEQECAYPELDGRDLEPDAVLHWATDPSGAVVGTLRVLHDANGDVRIGRVATAVSARGAGLAARMVTAVLDSAPADVDVVLDAQSHLAGWYARFGFTVAGEEYVEDGIPHVPMRRIATHPRNGG
ncbi:GNAT family N-acetyltransferase [Jatrophihabitans sp. YIM 134969]